MPPTQRRPVLSDVRSTPHDPQLVDLAYNEKSASHSRILSAHIHSAQCGRRRAGGEGGKATKTTYLPLRLIIRDKDIKVALTQLIEHIQDSLLRRPRAPRLVGRCRGGEPGVGPAGAVSVRVVNEDEYGRL